ncbi:major capsid protein [Azospirillum picis]|uniref:Major capsid protein n=1 Tax=Azospirillum picis TaxID=488438 RepID=A0ABU0MVC8_9PROT|nr:major capsid protein [Azospirillum picis]MBP2303322.1 hypothetical protein [Azospirillum picis]MDQ0537138.1 hypothetical protein [Azospirillum picis]
MGNTVINLFKNKLFSTVALTDEINDRDLVPDQISSLVPFEEKSIITTSFMVVRKGHSLSLVPFSERGAPGKEYVSDKRDGILFDSRQLRQEFTVTADELQDVLLFGSMGERLEALQDKVREHLDDVLDDERNTMEYHKLGVIKGQLMDVDGVTVLEDLFDKFGVDRPDDISFTAAEGKLREHCTNVIRAIRAGAQAKVDEVHAFCGKNFMDYLYSHPDVVKGYQYYRDNERLRDRAAYVPLDFGGIQFEEYTGYTEDVEFVADGDAHFFPLGLSGANPASGATPASRLFQQRWSPAPFFSRINSPGIPHYVRVFFESGDDPSWVKFEISSYPTFFCRKPRVLVRGRKA